MKAVHCKQRKPALRTLHAALLAGLLAMLLLPAAAVDAASHTLSATAQKQFDKTKAALASADAAKLQSLYNSFIQLQEQNSARDARIKSASKLNDTNESALRQKIQAIDKAKIEALEQKVAKTKELYQPLFDDYAAAQAELKAIKKLGIKELTAAAQLNVDLLEISVKAAKADIRSVQAVLGEAKSNASAKMKRLRDQLAAIDQEEERIAPEKSAISQLNKQKSAEWSDFLYALRSADGKNAIRSMTTLEAAVREIGTRQSKIEGCETRIAAIIKSVTGQL